MTARALYFRRRSGGLAGPGLAGCATPPAVVPTAADVRGLKPTGKVTMTEVFVSGTGLGHGALTFKGRRYPFTLTGELNGLGALSGIEGAGDVYNLRDVSQFAGAYIQGAPPLSVGSRRRDLAEEHERRDHPPSRAKRNHHQLGALRDLYPARRLTTRATGAAASHRRSARCAPYVAAVREHFPGRAQFDDITCVSLMRRAPGESK